jgi:diguanylate cyclase (GGDEF)-like protein
LLIPTLPLAIFVLGWVRLAGQQAGMYDTAFGLALMVLLSSTVSVIAVAWTAFALHRVDGTRKRAEAEILTLNADLERRVQERTLQLARLSEQLSAANKSLEDLSLHDGLTGLANRRYFDTYLASQVAIAHRHKRPLALVMLDVDAFKAYNDFYGHPTGDECLKQIAAALRSCCRRPADLVARYGGEEFAMILPDTELAGATKIAEAARNAVGVLKIPHARSPTASYVSISGGVAAVVRTFEVSAQQLIAAADQALYQAKHLGRDRIVTASVATAAARIQASVALS